MSNTTKTWTQDQPFGDGQLFIGPSLFLDPSGNSASASAGPGLFSLNQAASKASTYFANLNAILRTGVYASFNSGERAFGTTGPPPVPGPSTVANTSGPRAIIVSPPVPKAQLPTIAGAAVGPVPKGIQINWLDVIYQVTAVNLTAATVGLTETVFANVVAPAVSNLVALGNNGLPLVAAAQPYRIRVTPSTISMITVDGTEVILNVNLTTPAGGTSKFYGVVAGVSFNYN